MALMAYAGLRAKSITLTAKDTITFADEPMTLVKSLYARYHDRLKPALHDLLEHEDRLTPSVIKPMLATHTGSISNFR